MRIVEPGCPVCHASGNLLTFNPLTWWTCPACGGQGVLQTGLAGSIQMHKPKKVKKSEIDLFNKLMTERQLGQAVTTPGCGPGSPGSTPGAGAKIG